MSNFIKKLAYWDGEEIAGLVFKKAQKNTKAFAEKAKAAQQALNIWFEKDSGYIPIKETGQFDNATIRAINKFLPEANLNLSSYKSYFDPSLLGDIILYANKYKEQGKPAAPEASATPAPAAPAVAPEAAAPVATEAAPVASVPVAPTAPVAGSDKILGNDSVKVDKKEEFIKKYEKNFKFLHPSVQNYILSQPFDPDKYLFMIHKYVKLTVESRAKKQKEFLQKVKNSFYKSNVEELRNLAKDPIVENKKIKKIIEKCVGVFDMPPPNNNPSKYPNMFNGLV